MGGCVPHCRSEEPVSRDVQTELLPKLSLSKAVRSPSDSSSLPPTRTPSPASSPPLSPRSSEDSCPLASGAGNTEASDEEPQPSGLRPQPRPWWRCSCRRRAAVELSSAPQTGAVAEKDDSLRAALDQFKDEMGPSLLATTQEYLVAGETLDSCLLRFLTARAFDVAAASKMLKQDLQWRAEFDVRAFATQTREDVLGCDSAVLRRYLPQWHSGFDKEGRPVIIKQYGRARLQPLLQETSVEALIRLHVYENESIAKLCGQQTTKLGKDITKSVVIVDGAGFDSCHLRMPKAFVWGKGMATIDQDHYPERLETLFLINAPTVLSYFWSLVSVVLDRKTKQKVRIFSGRDQWEPALLEMIDASQLPPEYGGITHRS